MAEWRVQILGERRDLRALQEILSGSGMLIVEEEGELLLKSAEWDDETKVEVVRDHAKQFVELLDQAAFFYFRDTALITIGNIARLKPDGTRDWYVFVDGSLSITSRLGATASILDTNGNEKADEPKEHPVKLYLRLAQESEAVCDAQRFFRKGDWSSLYKVYEIIRDNEGEYIWKQDALLNKVVKRFTQIVQSKIALGDEARHAAKKYKPPLEWMSIGEARALIGEILRRWMNLVRTR